MPWNIKRKLSVVACVVCAALYVWLFHFYPALTNYRMKEQALSDYCNIASTQTSKGNFSILPPRHYLDGENVTNNVWNKTSGNRSDNLLTLFTSWPDNPSKYFIYNNTLLNWGLLHVQNISTVLFTNDENLGDWARQAGWWVLPITQTAPIRDGPPILPTMFRQVMRLLKSKFYGFVNGDILFDSSLVATLNAILDDECFHENRHVLITGRRTNLRRVSRQDALHWPLLERKAKQGGVLFTDYSSDYFITNPEYPWSDYPDIAIARRAYDNWLVLRANQLGHVVVDGSRTILAVHQEKKSDDVDRMTRCKANYNVDLIEHTYGRVDYGAGRTTCAEYETRFSEIGTVFILKRLKRPKFCYHLLH